jgi:AbiV family abortive infection protein
MIPPYNKDCRIRIEKAMTPFKPPALKAMEACRNHAKDAFEGAKLLRQSGKPNLAYHLATIALEELGKSQLIGMRSFAKDEADSWYSKQIDDHVKKLFWALWGQFLGTNRPDPKEIERIRGTATIIHENRLRGLYVDTDLQHRSRRAGQGSVCGVSTR